jgi:hypothetical protein
MVQPQISRSGQEVPAERSKSTASNQRPWDEQARLVDRTLGERQQHLAGIVDSAAEAIIAVATYRQCFLIAPSKNSSSPAGEAISRSTNAEVPSLSSLLIPNISNLLESLAHQPARWEDRKGYRLRGNSGSSLWKLQFSPGEAGCRKRYAASKSDITLRARQRALLAGYLWCTIKAL